jgi:DUF1009 family protein
MRNHTPKEEKVAIKIADMLSDLRLDLEQVGVFIARQVPATGYRRLQVIAESANYTREQSELRLANMNQPTLWED